MLHLEQLIANARDVTGLEDFGSDDFLEPLTRLLDALNAEADLNAFGVFRARASIDSGLEYRLRIQEYVSSNRDLLERPVRRPVFIVGLPRTGTTALHHMLNHDPRNHTLRLWEAQRPVPPPEDATYTSDPRIAETEAGVALTEELTPGFLSAHLLASEEPDECHMLFNRSFMSVEYSALYHIPSYANWLYRQDLRQAYAYHKLQLQLLQHKKLGHWILKSPFHQLGLETILNTYPDALIVQTHRSPATIVASGCSFNELIRERGSDTVDPRMIGRDWMDMLRAYTLSFGAAREKLEPHFPDQFIDIRHDEFVANPWPGIEAIYARLGRDLGSGGRAGMLAWLDEHPKGKHGTRDYSLERYGIDRDEVDELFADYVERYGLGWDDGLG